MQNLRNNKLDFLIFVFAYIYSYMEMKFMYT